MSGIIRRLVIGLSFCVAVIILGWRTTTPSQIIHAQAQTIGHSTTSNAYLELSVEPRIARKETIVTLKIIYHQIGLPYTYISVYPDENVALDPPISMPCKYDQHPNGCREITFRALSNGIVKFNAGATGEVYDESCGCFVWGTAKDNGPAYLIIVDTIWRAFIPIIQR